jgi:hypothetical protein
VVGQSGSIGYQLNLVEKEATSKNWRGQFCATLDKKAFVSFFSTVL